MKRTNKLKRRAKKRQLEVLSSITAVLMLIAGSKLAGFSAPVKALESLGSYISTVFSNNEYDEISDNQRDINLLANSSANGLQNTATETYIYTAEDLAEFRDKVNEGDNYEGKTVYLMNDIDLSTECSADIGSWEPIGTGKDEKGNAVYFSGTFDGNYHSISNLYMNTDKYRCLGLFVQTNSRTIIENVVFNNIYCYDNYVSTGYMMTGALVGYNAGLIINCGIDSGIVTAYRNSSREILAVGGIVGENYGSIINCYNKSNVTGTGTVTNYLRIGGIVSDNCAGGIITNCYNQGLISGSAKGNIVQIGGIAGIQYASSLMSSISNCYNIGTLNVISGSTIERGGVIGSNGQNSTYYAGTYSNNYCTDDTPYACQGRGSTTTGVVSKETIKGYTTILSSAYENDDWGINEGYPILWWEAPTIQLNKNQAYIKENEQLKLSVMRAQSACPEKVIEEILKGEFEWTSTNEDVATVDQNGKVTGKKDGYTTIYAHHKTDNLYAMCVVNVAKETTNPQIATGNGFTAILKSDGRVWIIGNNNNGQLGVNNVLNESNPQIVHEDIDTELKNIRKIAVGSNHVLALANDGKVYAWGANDYGQLGQGNTENLKYATPVLGTDGASYLSNIVDIEAGGYGSVALDEEGNVYIWGNGTNGEIGNKTTESKNIPVKVTGVKNAIQVSIGNGHVGALTSDGVVWTWGLNANGQLGINSVVNTSYPTRTVLGAIEISLGGHHTAIKKIDGTVEVAGIKNNGRIGIAGTGNQTTFTPLDLSTILGTDETSESNANKKIKYIKAGQANTTILLSDGTVWETGFNLHGELGNGTNATSTNFVQGLMGENEPVEKVLTIGKNIGDVKGLETTGLGLNTALILDNGDIYTTGNNKYRQIGNNEIEDKTYYTKMWYAYLDYEDKTVILEGKKGYQIDKNKTSYIQSVVNAYYDEPLLTVKNLTYKIKDETLATVDSSGYITPNEGVTGATRVEIEDIENGYKAYFTLVVNKLQNTDTVTYIYDAQDLSKFRDSVNEGNDYAGKTVYVMADIDMSDICSVSKGSFEPIGTYEDEKGNEVYFAGTFDGNYHIISNLYINTNLYPNLGLFTANTSTTVIQNLVMKDIYVYNDYEVGESNNSTGGIVGYNYGNIINCGIESGSVTDYREVVGDRWKGAIVGGIVGWSVSRRNKFLL